MEFRRITGAEHPLYEKAMELYAVSFPEHEQRLPESQRAILQNDAYHFDLILEENQWVGEILYWETADFIYVEHFCMRPQVRGQGLGKRALALLAEKGKTVILEIDPPVDDISRRRREFYFRCGYRENPYAHVHPAYRAGNAGHELVILSCPEAISEGECARFQAYLKETVVKNAF